MAHVCYVHVVAHMFVRACRMGTCASKNELNVTTISSWPVGAIWRANHSTGSFFNIVSVCVCNVHYVCVMHD
eukprot:SAG11_NODE_177_length_13334_cov_9.614280_7_plen_72_part_00